MYDRELALIKERTYNFLFSYWYMSALDSTVATNAREIARHEIRINEIEKTAQLQAIMLGRIDENIKAIRDSVDAMRKRSESN